MRGRVLLTGLLAGIALFVWLGVAHMALPLGRAGVSELPNEDVVLAAMRNNVSQPGFYIFPGGGMLSAKTPEETKVAQAAMSKKMAAGPWGIMIYHSNGTAPISPRQLLTEFAANLVEATLAVWLISLAAGVSITARICFGVTIGIIASMMTNISYWNWYGFPGRYTTANMATQILGFALVGLVAALMLKKPPKAKEMIGAGK